MANVSWRGAKMLALKHMTNVSSSLWMQWAGRIWNESCCWSLLLLIWHLICFTVSGGSVWHTQADRQTGMPGHMLQAERREGECEGVDGALTVQKDGGLSVRKSSLWAEERVWRWSHIPLNNVCQALSFSGSDWSRNTKQTHHTPPSTTSQEKRLKGFTKDQ